MKREDLIREFWKVAKSGKYDNPYTTAAHHLINLMETGGPAMFVAKKSREHEVTLNFNDRGCTVLVDGVNVLSLRGDCVILHKYVSEDATGLRVHPKFGYVHTEVEA